MTNTYKLAGRIIAVSTQYDELHRLCADYAVADSVPDFSVSVSQPDIDLERERSARENAVEGKLIRGERPWAAYMRAKFREKDVLQQEVFLAADLSERYGYKLIAEEKHTTQRDVILRLCLAAHFRLDETQEALILYGMAPLLGRIPRDAAFIVAFQNRIYDIHDVDAILRENDLPPFLI